jgi:hypothetical protein
VDFWRGNEIDDIPSKEYSLMTIHLAEPHSMTGHRPFRELRKRMSPERRARNAAVIKEMLAEMALHELRQARERSQEELARALKVGQPANLVVIRHSTYAS